jgi:hypothetical protein
MLRTLFFYAIGSLCLIASPVTFNLHGTFGDVISQVNGTPYFMPDSSFTLSFQVDNPPTPSEFNTTLELFDTSYSDAVYTLNGVPVATTGSLLQFGGNGAPNYPLYICFDAACNFELDLGDKVNSPQFYSGPESGPTIEAGLYFVDSVLGRATSDQFPGPATTVSITDGGDSGSVPEPATAVLTGAIGALSMLARRLTQRG